MHLILWETYRVGAKIFYATVLATGDEQWRCSVKILEKLRLLQKIQIQVVAANWRSRGRIFWWRRCVKKWEVATMSDILMTVSTSICGRISWNNSVSD